MAAFAIPLVMSFVGAYAGKKLGDKGKVGDAPATPAPSTANPFPAPPPPAPVAQTQSAAVKTGQQAAQKTKRKMAPPVLGPRDGTFSTQPVRSVNAPRTLIGSGY